MRAALLSILLLLAVAACLRDLGVDDRLYACQTHGDCAEGFTCVPVTGQSYAGVCERNDDDVVDGDVVDDDVVTPDPADLCRPCSSDGDCDQGRCTQLPAGRFCTSACSTNDDCPSGYFCFALGVGEPRCVPALVNTCAGCLQQPCDAGSYCDQAAGECRPAVPACEACVHDPECGVGSRCLAFGPLERRCVPDCAGGCPANATCQVFSREQGTEGVRACVPDTAACCFGPDCGGCDCGQGQICLDGACVECVTDLQCPLDRPLCQGGFCAAGTCEGETPFACWQSPTGCCACGADDDCGVGQLCDLVTGECGVLPPSCDCVPPYGACTLQDGVGVCAECVTDGDCGGYCSCDPWQRRCIQPSGGFCQSTCASPCVTDGDCPSALGLALVCDGSCCRDVSGTCNNVEAFCTVAGSECTSITDELHDGGSEAMAMPGAVDLDGDGLADDTLPAGLCSCTRSIECASVDFAAAPVGEKELTAPVCCPAGQQCVELVQLLSFVQGATYDLTSVQDGGPGVCFTNVAFGPLRGQ
jgi:hypothetical protein